MSRSVQLVFDQYRIQRNGFATSMAELSLKPEHSQQIISQGGIPLLRNLLTDSSQAIQQNAAIAVGRLAGHDPKIAQLMIDQDIIRILLFFNMDKTNKYLKRAALLALRSVVRHSAELSKSVIDLGGLDQVVASLAEFDPGVKEAAAWVCGYIARHDLSSAYSVIQSGAVSSLILCLQEPETSVRAVAASALSDICKHSPETAQIVIEAGAVYRLAQSLQTGDSKLIRQTLNCFAMIAKHSLHMAHQIIEADPLIKLVIGYCTNCDELVAKAGCGVIREIVKHSPENASTIVEAGGLGVLINAIIKLQGENKIPAIMSIGYIAGHDPNLAKAIINLDGTNALSSALDEDTGSGHVGAAAAWALGHIARHSPEHAKSVSLCGLLPKILKIYMSPTSTEEMKEKTKTALKMVLFKIEDLSCVEPLLSTAPTNILKYVVAQYSKVLPRDPIARRNFVASKGLQKLQELLNGPGVDDPILREHIQLINQCYPEEVVKYFSPNYPSSLLDVVDKYNPTLNIDPTLWSTRLFSDANIPNEIKEEIEVLQQLLQSKTQESSSNENDEKIPSTDPIEEMNKGKGKKISFVGSRSGSGDTSGFGSILKKGSK